MEDTWGDSFIPGLSQDVAIQCMARVPLTSLWGVCKQWQQMLVKSKEFHYARAERGKSEVNWLYTMVRTREGRFEWNALDPLTERWHPLPDMPESVDFQLTTAGSIGVSHDIQCASTKKKLVMVAGLKPANANVNNQSWSQLEPALQQPFVFDPKTCEWKNGMPFHTPRKWCACGVADEKVYVASGCGQQWDMSLSKRVEEYDPESDSWSVVRELESSKYSGEAITAVTVQNKLHMVSGKGVFMKEGVVFSPKTNSWSKMSPGLKRGWTGTCVSVNDRFYLIDEDGGKLSTYSAETDSWTVVLDDPKLKEMKNIIASEGKIIGVVNSAHTNAEVDGSSLKILDVTMDPPVCYTQLVPQGRVVSLQVLAKMNMHQ